MGLLLIVSLAYTQAEDINDIFEDPEEDEGKEAVETYPVDEESGTPTLPPTYELNTEEKTPTINTNAQEHTYDYVELEGTTSHEYEWQTPYGSFNNFELLDSVWKLGVLTQASILSFTNNNNLFFGSTFDQSFFQLTLDNEQQAQIVQRNTNGNMGKVHITTDGNLTQDDAIIFLPNGDNPTYIYYNTTEIEFEDGSIILLNEELTNKDKTKEPSTIQFNENGFTKVKIHPENNYTIGDLKFTNNNRNPIFACKKDSSCEINIDQNYTIKGKVNTYYQEKLIIQSSDNGNEINLNLETGETTLKNTNPNSETLALLYTGFHLITETSENRFSTFTNQESPYLITSFSSDKLPLLQIKDKKLYYEDTNNKVISIPENEIKDCITNYKELINNGNEKKEYC